MIYYSPQLEKSAFKPIPLTVTDTLNEFRQNTPFELGNARISYIIIYNFNSCTVLP